MNVTWSYGESVILEKDAAQEPLWSYGESVLFYEYEEEAGSSIIPLFQYYHNQART